MGPRIDDHSLLLDHKNGVNGPQRLQESWAWNEQWAARLEISNETRTDWKGMAASTLLKGVRRPIFCCDFCKAPGSGLAKTNMSQSTMHTLEMGSSVLLR